MDRQTIALIRVISEFLEEKGSGIIQYFDFEIRGKRISGKLKIEVEDSESYKSKQELKE